MLGLRTQEDCKFENFFLIVQQEAKKSGFAFFLDCGEGREFETAELCGEDLSGWLIPLVQADEFEAQFQVNRVSEKWLPFIRFAKWIKVKNDIQIVFQQF